jgi:hypothetical protein|tara:strand:- start:3070 stop:3459 length:390 start_codon:yes stop_codon:yes gene_type:complete
VGSEPLGPPISFGNYFGVSLGFSFFVSFSFGGIGSPISVLYFMASTDSAPIQRANNVISASMLIPMVLALLIYRGKVTEIILTQATILFFPFTAEMWLDAHSFTKVSADIFCKAVLVLLVVIGVLVLSL